MCTFQPMWKPHASGDSGGDTVKVAEFFLTSNNVGLVSAVPAQYIRLSGASPASGGGVGATG